MIDTPGGLQITIETQNYVLDSLDVITPIQSAQPWLWYDETQVAAIMSNDNAGRKLIFCAFPFEFIKTSAERIEVMYQVLIHLFVMDSVSDHKKNNSPNTYIPKKFKLEQNYPNPFNNETLIRYHIPEKSDVSIKIFNLLGQQIRLIDQKKTLPGIYYSIWDGRDDNNKRVPGGIYFAVLEVDDFRLTKKLLLLQ